MLIALKKNKTLILTFLNFLIKPFNFQLIYSFNQNEFNAWDVKRGIEEWIYNMPPGETPDWVAGSHDHHRVATRVHRDKVDQINAVVLTLPGASITYYVRTKFLIFRSNLYFII